MKKPNVCFLFVLRVWLRLIRKANRFHSIGFSDIETELLRNLHADCEIHLENNPLSERSCQDLEKLVRNNRRKITFSPFRELPF